MRVPPFVLPVAFRRMRGRAWAERIIKESLDRMRCAPAREWILRRVRVCYGKMPKWMDRISANRECRAVQCEVPAALGQGDPSLPILFISVMR